VAALGAALILIGIVLQIVQLFTSIRDRAQLRDLTGDPWDGRSLEWSTASPPPSYNFAVLPRVESGDAFWALKQAKEPARAPQYEAIEVPRNSPNGFVTAFFAVVTGFALIWHIWWMASLGLVCALGTLLVFAWLPRTEVEISAETLAAAERTRRSAAPGTA